MKTLLMMALLASASSWMECTFEAKVTSIDDKKVRFSAVEFIRSDGMIEPGPETCRTKIEDSSISLEEFKNGREALIQGANVRLIWSSYGGMGPNGPVSSTGWRAVKKDTQGPGPKPCSGGKSCSQPGSAPPAR